MLHHSSLEIQQRENQGIAILDLRGKLEMGRGDIVLRDYVENVLGAANHRLIFNLEHVSDIDTAGSGVLLFLAQEYRQNGGKLVLFHVGRVHAQIYELARLETVIEIYRDEIDAINSFFPDRTPSRYDILDYVESQKDPK